MQIKKLCYAAVTHNHENFLNKENLAIFQLAAYKRNTIGTQAGKRELAFVVALLGLLLDIVQRMERCREISRTT